MTTLEKLEKLMRERVDVGGHAVLDCTLLTGPSVFVRVYASQRDLEDDTPVAPPGVGPNLEAALVDLLANMGAL